MTNWNKLSGRQRWPMFGISLVVSSCCFGETENRLLWTLNEFLKSDAHYFPRLSNYKLDIPAMNALVIQLLTSTSLTSVVPSFRTRDTGFCGEVPVWDMRETPSGYGGALRSEENDQKGMVESIAAHNVTVTPSISLLWSPFNHEGKEAFGF